MIELPTMHYLHPLRVEIFKVVCRGEMQINSLMKVYTIGEY